ncbi:MAG: hypothetical protein ACK44H_02510, partial [Candidatus Kryptonium sp.]
MKIITNGKEIAAIIEPSETYRVKATTTTKIKKEIKETKEKLNAKFIVQSTNLAHGVDYKTLVKSIL